MSTPTAPDAQPSQQALWQRAWEEAQPSLEEIRGRLAKASFVPARAVRVGQLDAELLDQELVTVLQDPIKKSLSLIKSTWGSSYNLELSLIIQAVLYKFSVWDTGATYGAKLQDLSFKRRPRVEGVRYAPSGLPQKILLGHAGLTILLPYLQARLRARALSRSWPDAPLSDIRRQSWEILTRLETLHATVALLGFIAFLWDGRYRSIADRLLGLKLVASRRVVARNVNYEFMNRQMVWHAFTEFLLFILPLVNLRVLRRRLARSIAKISWSSFLPSRLTGTSSSTTDAGATRPGSSKQRQGRYFALPEDCCAICAENSGHVMDSKAPGIFPSFPSTPQPSGNTDPAPLEQPGYSEEEQPMFPINIPYTTSCDHLYCYHCLADKMMRAQEDGEIGWECLRCDAVVLSADRVELQLDDAGTDEGLSDGSWEGDGTSGSFTSEDFPSSPSDRGT